MHVLKTLWEIRTGKFGKLYIVELFRSKLSLMAEKPWKYQSRFWCNKDHVNKTMSQEVCIQLPSSFLPCFSLFPLYLHYIWIAAELLYASFSNILVDASKIKVDMEEWESEARVLAYQDFKWIGARESSCLVVLVVSSAQTTMLDAQWQMGKWKIGIYVSHKKGI